MSGKIDPIGSFLWGSLAGWLARQSRDRDRELARLEREAEREQRQAQKDAERREREERRAEIAALAKAQADLARSKAAAAAAAAKTSAAAKQQQLRLVVSAVYQRVQSDLSAHQCGQGFGLASILGAAEIESIARKLASLVASELRGL